jgi:hypothetical protein
LTQLQLIDTSTGPDEAPDDITAKQQGQAGECLVELELLVRGYPVSRASDGEPYDLIMRHGRRFLGIQVKTCSRPLASQSSGRDGWRYGFTTKRGHRSGAQARYADGDVQIFAFVALDIRKVYFMSASGDVEKTKQRWSPAVFTREDITENSLARCLAELA